MDSRKIKIIGIFLVFILIVGLISFYSFKAVEAPRIKARVESTVITNMGVSEIYVANEDIKAGEVITSDMITKANALDTTMVDVENLPTDLDEIVGKISKIEIYKGEQIILNRLEDNPQNENQRMTTKEDAKKSTSNKEGNNNNLVSTGTIREDLRKITIDVPNYGFVNGLVTEGTVVDLMVDYGDGKYAKVIEDSIYIYEIKDIEADAIWTTVNDADEENEPLGEKLANTTTTDKRVTILANEKQQTKIFEVSKKGKFFFRLHMDEGKRSE